MKKVFALIIPLFLGLFLYSSNTYAGLQKAYTHTTYLGPIIKLGYASSIFDYTSAYSLVGEVAPRNFRVDATIAWKPAKNQCFKLSAEFLRQNITYSFFRDNPEEWTQQGTISFNYRYDWLGLQPEP